MNKDQIFPTGAIIAGVLVIAVPQLLSWVLGLYLIIWGIVKLAHKA